MFWPGQQITILPHFKAVEYGVDPDQGVLRREVTAWQDQRNHDAIRVDLRFTTEDARIKLKSLYPSIQH